MKHIDENINGKYCELCKQRIAEPNETLCSRLHLLYLQRYYTKHSQSCNNDERKQTEILPEEEVDQ